MPANLFLTGPMRFGKSTLLNSIIAQTGISVSGYFIQRQLVNGQTRAFRMMDASIESYVPDIETEQIHNDADTIGYIGDNLSWHPEVFEDKGVSIIKKSLLGKKSFILMDELGRIEVIAPKFRKMVFEALDSEQPVIGILKQENNEFLNAIRQRPDVTIVDLNNMTHQQARSKIESFIGVSKMWEIYDQLIDAIPEDLTVKEYMIGMHWILVRSERGLGLAKTVRNGQPGAKLENIIGMPLKELAKYIKSWNMIDASLGLAAINSVFNNKANIMNISDPDGDDQEDSQPEDLNAFTRYIKDIVGKKVAVVGHFPKIEALNDICQLTIIDKSPRRPGDYPESACEYILPEQDVVYITGTCIINKTLPRMIELSKNAKIILIGPSVPMSFCLFAHGVDTIAGMMVVDDQALWQAVLEGGNKNIYDQGGQRVCISR